MEANEILLDRAGIIRDAGPLVAPIFGTTTAVMGGKNMMSFVPAGMHEMFYEFWMRIVDGKQKILFLSCEHPAGHLVPIVLRLTSKAVKQITDRGEGDEILFTMRVVDRSGHSELEAELSHLRESYLLLAETTTDVILQIDSDLRIAFANSAVEGILGYTPAELLHRELSGLFPKSQYQRYRERISKYFIIDEDHRRETGMHNVIEVLAKRKSGDLIPVEISLGNSRSVGARRMLTCILRDITLRKKADRRLKYLAYHDKLTSLGNRDRFAESLKRVLADTNGDSQRAALLYLDLDGFKKINDGLGHEIGDTILKACAQRLVNSLRQGDQVYQFDFEEIFRMGGDEFTILLPIVREPEDAAVVARRIIEKITEPFSLDEFEAIGEIKLGVSIGIAVIPDDGTDATTLLRNADAAMYKAKEEGNSFAFFTEDMNSMAIERLMLEQGIRKAFARNELELYYQPIVDVDGNAVSYEALVRWNHPDRGILAPDIFLPVLEDMGLIIAFGTWAFSTACRDLMKLREWGGESVTVSVNLTPRQLAEPDVAELIRKSLDRSGLDPTSLTIELTETAVMGNPERAQRKLHAIKRLNPGIRFAIDDFGTGYSSLAYLTNYPVDNLKIDRSFVMQMHANENAKVVKTIIDLGKVLNLKVVAEGVETSEQFAILKDQNCDYFQGYLFNRALPMNELEVILTRTGEMSSE